jgi:hypothetical protein
VRWKTWPVIALLLGVAIIAATVYYIILGVNHPSSDSSIKIALLSAIGMPIALGAITAGYRGLHEPNAETLKTEAEAQRRAAAALEDAETAEKIKSELEAYVAVRTFRLEIERKRQELSRSANATLTLLKELNEDEVRLGEAETRLDPITVETLNSLLQDSDIPAFLALFLDIMSIASIAMPFGGSGASSFVETIARQFYDYLRKRELRRLARLVPDALAAPDDKPPTDGASLGENQLSPYLHDRLRRCGLHGMWPRAQSERS